MTISCEAVVGTYRINAPLIGDMEVMKITPTEITWRDDTVKIGSGAHWVGSMLKVDFLECKPGEPKAWGLPPTEPTVLNKEELVLTFEKDGLSATGMLHIQHQEPFPVSAKRVDMVEVTGDTTSAGGGAGADVVGKLKRLMSSTFGAAGKWLKRLAFGVAVVLALPLLLELLATSSAPSPPAPQPTEIQRVDSLKNGQYVVAWHVNDHAEGKVFATKQAAMKEFDDRLGGPWAERLYDAQGNILSEYGSMSSYYWRQLDLWREQNAPSQTFNRYVNVPVEFLAANDFGLSARNVRPGQQLTNVRSDGDEFIVRAIRPGVYGIESLSNPGYFIGIDSGRDFVSRPGYKGSSDKFAAVLVTSSDPRAEVQVVPSRNGSDKFVSFESVDIPGLLLNHCDGRMWFFGSPANSEGIFSQDASWQLKK